jgi:hypothetical protein
MSRQLVDAGGRRAIDQEADMISVGVNQEPGVQNWNMFQFREDWRRNDGRTFRLQGTPRPCIVGEYRRCEPNLEIDTLRAAVRPTSACSEIWIL